MGVYYLGLILLLRPFEVWMASYSLHETVERRDTVRGIDYILLGLNALATISFGVLLWLIKSGKMQIGNPNSILVVLLASTCVIWIIWIFTGIFKSASNNKRGITMSTSTMKTLDNIMLLAVLPAALLGAMYKITDAVFNQRESIAEAGTGLFVLILFGIIIVMSVVYLISIKDRFEHYIVFGKKSVEIWNGNRGKVYKYSQIKSADKVEGSFGQNNTYKIVFVREDGKDDPIKVDDRRLGTVIRTIKSQIEENRKSSSDLSSIRENATNSKNASRTEREATNSKNASRTEREASNSKNASRTEREASNSKNASRTGREASNSKNANRTEREANSSRNTKGNNRETNGTKGTNNNRKETNTNKKNTSTNKNKYR